MQPAPDRAAADLPGIRRPGLHAEILALHPFVIGMEVLADQHVLVGPGAIGAPGDLAGVLVDRGQPAAHAQFAAAVADHDLAVHDERGHGDGLALVDVAELGVPEFLAGLGVERDGIVVQRVEKYLAVVVGEPAVDHVAAGDADGGQIWLRRIGPLQVAGRRVEREDLVRMRPDVRPHHVQRAVDDERRGFLAAVGADREGPGDMQVLDVLAVDLIEPAVARVRIVLLRHRPIVLIPTQLDEIAAFVLGAFGLLLLWDRGFLRLRCGRLLSLHGRRLLRLRLGGLLRCVIELRRLCNGGRGGRLRGGGSGG